MRGLGGLVSSCRSLTEMLSLLRVTEYRGWLKEKLYAFRMIAPVRRKLAGARLVSTRFCRC